MVNRIIFSVILTIIRLLFGQPTFDEDCIIQTDRILSCTDNLPETIPKRIREVYVTEFNQSFTVRKSVFENPTWKWIENLDININSKWEDIILFDGDFSTLNNLSRLGIHASGLKAIEQGGFAGLDKLTELDLSGCNDLKSQEIIPSLLYNNSTPNLKFLKLKNFSTKTKRGLFQLSKNFTEMLQIKAIERLSLSGTNIVVEDLEAFNISVALWDLDISNCTWFVTDTNHKFRWAIYFKPFLQNIKYANISWIPFRLFLHRIPELNLDTIKTCPISEMLPSLESIDASNIITFGWNLFLIKGNVTQNASNCLTNLKAFYSRGNHITKVNFTIDWLKKAKLVKIDLSSNEISYLSPRTFNKQLKLKNLLLSNNSLYKMEQLPDFGDLLHKFNLLEHFAIAYNKLTFIPRHMFLSNIKLKHLDLKGNIFTAITFQLRHLEMLQVLELQDNNIVHLDGSGFAQLQHVFYIANKSHSFDVNFQGNPLECSCKTLRFITWLFKKLQPFTNKMNKCRLDEDLVSVDEIALERSNLMCLQGYIILGASVSSLLMAIIFAMAMVIILRKAKKRKQTNVIAKFLKNFKRGRLDEKKLVFLSYCNDDSENIIERFKNVLEERLKKMLGLEENVISLGDLDFRPGLSIVIEIMRCIADSCVVIFVISRAFCASSWCRMELKEAYELDKPIILVFKESVDTDKMPDYLFNIFKRSTRVKLIEKDGKYEVMPDWQSLCDSVILLASNKEQNKKDLLKTGGYKIDAV